MARKPKPTPETAAPSGFGGKSAPIDTSGVVEPTADNAIDNSKDNK